MNEFRFRLLPGSLGGLDDGGVLNFDEASPRELLQLGQQFVHALGRFNNLDFHGQVLGQFHETSGVNVVIRPEASYSTEDRCARDAPVEEEVENRRVNGVAVVL